MANRWGNNGNSDRLSFLGLQSHCRWWLSSVQFSSVAQLCLTLCDPMMVTAAMKLKDAPWKKSYDQHRQHIKKQRHCFVNKFMSSQSYSFSSSRVWMWELDYKESLALKNWCFWTVVLDKTLESPLDCKEIQLVHPKGISPEYSLEGLMLKLKLQYFVTWCEELTYLKRPWCWERLKAGGEGDNRG